MILVHLRICCKINKDSFWLFLILCLCMFVTLFYWTICCKINKDSFWLFPMFCLHLFVVYITWQYAVTWIKTAFDNLMFCFCLFVILVHLIRCCKINKYRFYVLFMICFCLFVMLVNLTICCKINKDSFCVLRMFVLLVCNVSSLDNMLYNK